MRLSLAILILLFITPGTHAQQKVTVQLDAFALPMPLQVKLQHPLSMAGAYVLVNKNNGKKIPAQLTDSVTLVFIPPTVNTAQEMQFEIRKLKPSSTTNQVEIKKNREGIQVSIGNRPILFYYTSEANQPADSSTYYKRSGFIHPLYSPGGSVLTDDFPAGHAHQHAIFAAWTNTSFKNTAVDFWNQHLKKGTVQHVEVLSVRQGPVFSELKTALRYLSFEHGSVLKEIWTLRFYPFKDYFLFDLESDQQNITKDTLFLNTYHYGGLAFRGSREWNPDDKINFRSPWHILTSEGLKDSSANQSHASWVDASGLVRGKSCGVTVFSHPSNFRHPQGIRVHPQMPYWCFTPTQDGPFNIPPAAFYHARYRYFVHEGSADSSRLREIEKRWNLYQ